MATKYKDLSKLLTICRKNGVAHIKIDGIELTLDHQALFPVSNYKKNKKEKEPVKGSDRIDSPDQFSEEDALFWSAAPHDLNQGEVN